MFQLNHDSAPTSLTNPTKEEQKQRPEINNQGGSIFDAGLHLVEASDLSGRARAFQSSILRYKHYELDFESDVGAALIDC